MHARDCMSLKSCVKQEQFGKIKSHFRSNHVSNHNKQTTHLHHAEKLLSFMKINFSKAQRYNEKKLGFDYFSSPLNEFSFHLQNFFYALRDKNNFCSES